MDRLIQAEYHHASEDGFTLIEILVALVISVIVCAGIYRTFESQNKTHIVQERNVEMQQTLRAVLVTMETDMKMAGFDPRESGNYGITTATASQLAFTLDDGAGGTTSIDYMLFDASDDTDISQNELQRMPGGSPLAFHLDRLRFAYAYDADGDGDTELQGGQIIWAVPRNNRWYNLDSNGDGVIDTNDNAGGVDTGTTVDIRDIRAVRIWVLARASRTDSTYTDTNTYVVGDSRYTPNDNYRRRLGQATVQMRNMGL